MREEQTYAQRIRALGSGLFLLLLVMVLDSCLSEIDLELPENDSESIAIVARLEYGDPSIASVRITSLANFIGFDQAVPILGARVTLLDESGNAIHLPADLEEGLNGELLEKGNYGRSLGNDFPINIGDAYMIRIELENKVYESTLETLADVPKADDIMVELITREELNNFGNIIENSYLQFFLNTPLRAPSGMDKAYLKWDFEGVYQVIETGLEVLIPPPTDICYVTIPLNIDKINVFNGQESREDYLQEEFMLEERLDHRFSRGFYLAIFQQSISQGAYNYWSQINSITDLSGNFFEDPPGKVLGNISNTSDPDEEVFGYFSTSRTDTIRFYVNPTDYLVRPKCPFSALPDDATLDDSCFDCLLLRNSTTVRPNYWIE